MRCFDHFVLENGVDIRGVLFDIDDTITTNGKLTTDAYVAIGRLKEAGMLVIAITGRPAGWCDQIARLWPVDGVIGENGAFYFYHDANAKKIVKRFVLDERTRAANRQIMAGVAQLVLREVPGSALASDQAYREADVAVDFCEDVPRLAATDVARIESLMVSHGLTAKVSSIHVNGWVGDYDKLTTTRLMFNEVFNIDLDTERSRYVFVGDSPNDQPMFAFFPRAVGVANIRDFAAQLSTPPAYVTRARNGAGFVEVAERLLTGTAAVT